MENVNRIARPEAVFEEEVEEYESSEYWSDYNEESEAYEHHYLDSAWHRSALQLYNEVCLYDDLDHLIAERELRADRGVDEESEDGMDEWVRAQVAQQEEEEDDYGDYEDTHEQDCYNIERMEATVRWLWKYHDNASAARCAALEYNEESEAYEQSHRYLDSAWHSSDLELYDDLDHLIAERELLAERELRPDRGVDEEEDDYGDYEDTHEQDCYNIERMDATVRWLWKYHHDNASAARRAAPDMEAEWDDATEAARRAAPDIAAEWDDAVEAARRARRAAPDMAAEWDDAVEAARRARRAAPDMAAEWDDAVEAARRVRRAVPDMAAEWDDAVEAARRVRRAAPDMAAEWDDDVEAARRVRRAVPDMAAEWDDAVEAARRVRRAAPDMAAEWDDAVEAARRAAPDMAAEWDDAMEAPDMAAERDNDMEAPDMARR